MNKEKVIEAKQLLKTLERLKEEGVKELLKVEEQTKTKQEELKQTKNKEARVEQVQPLLADMSKSSYLKGRIDILAALITEITTQIGSNKEVIQ